MRKLSTLLRIIDAISEWSGKVVSLAIILIIGIILWNVLQRYVFHSGTTWNIVTAAKIFSVYIILGAAYALRMQVHVNVDILYKNLSLRGRGIVGMITFAAFFMFCLALLWMSIWAVFWESTWPHFHFSLRSFLPNNWPVSPLIPAGVLLFLLQGLAQFIRDLMIVITGKEPA